MQAENDDDLDDLNGATASSCFRENVIVPGKIVHFCVV